GQRRTDAGGRGVHHRRTRRCVRAAHRGRSSDRGGPEPANPAGPARARGPQVDRSVDLSTPTCTYRLTQHDIYARYAAQICRLHTTHSVGTCPGLRSWHTPRAGGPATAAGVLAWTFA